MPVAQVEAPPAPPEVATLLQAAVLSPPSASTVPRRSRAWSSLLAQAVLGGLLCLQAPGTAQARTFQAEGADAGMGVGPRYIALGGSGVALSDDVYAAYHNPAGLAELDGIVITVARQLNAELRPLNFLGIAARLPLPAQWGYKASLAAVYYPRIHAHSTGAYAETEAESVFLRYLLPGVNGTFDGEIDSKTKVYRLALGVAPADAERWSAGFNVDYIDCKTNFCGIHATSNGYTVASSGATAISYGAGFKYRASPRLTLAGAVSDIDTRLNVEMVTTDSAGTRYSTFQAAFPRKVALGMAYRFGPAALLTGNYEITQGTYGSNRLDVQMVRLGVEFRHSAALTSRFGAVAPIKIKSDKVPDIPLPFPLAPTAGLGWQLPHLRVDLAVYAHPLMSVHKGGVAPAADLSLSVDF